MHLLATEIFVIVMGADRTHGRTPFSTNTKTHVTDNVKSASKVINNDNDITGNCIINLPH